MEDAGIAVILILTAWFYFWTATTAGSPLTFERPAYDLYNRLADGFLAGRTSFLEDAPPELARLADPYDPEQNAPYKKYHDISYYHGRYYLYFGPTPALVLLAPWKLVTGSSLPQNIAVVVFAWGSALLGALLLRELRRRYFPNIPGWVLLAAVVAVAWGNMLPILLRRPLYYELAIASACFFGLGAAGCLLLSLGRKGFSRPGWLAGAGLCLGLAVGARPDYLFGIFAMLAFWLRREWRQSRPRGWKAWGEVMRPLFPMLLALALVGVGLMLYNLFRFDHPLEFGMRYQMAGGNQAGLKFMSLWFLLPNGYYYFFAPPHLSAYFPYLTVTGILPFGLPVGYSGQENMYGLLFSFPWLLGLIWLWRGLRAERGVDGLREFVRLIGAMAGGILVFLLLIAGANNRYLVDFVPLATVLAGCGIMLLEAQSAGWRRGLARVGWIVALGWTVLFNVLVSLQHNDLFRYHNPVDYARLARLANGWSEHLTGAADRSGPLRIELTLPTNREGKLEPLIVTGASFRADFLYVFYKDDRHIQIGFEHTSYGGPMSPPLRVDYGQPHVLEIEMGSFYPPVEHPYFDDLSVAEITRLKRTLMVKLDGRVVHEGLYDFYDSSPGDVAVGHNPVSDAFGRKFTGVIRHVTRSAPR